MKAGAKRIVLGYDGSEGARRALERTIELSGYGSHVTVVTVAQSANGWSRRILEEARTRLARKLVAAELREEVGEPAEQLLAAAGDLDADILVVGGSATPRPVLGSVAGRVAAAASCDVLVVN
jgi:nucleotide-binding universal stress UspA family protein